MARYLVTGVAGFIGRSIAAALLARGETVRGVDSFITGKRENLIGLAAMEFLQGDLTDPAVQKELETYIPLIQQGKGAEVLFR